MAQAITNSGNSTSTTFRGIEMEERREPEFIKLDAEGEFVEGVLVSVAPCEVKNENGQVNRAVRYTVQNPEGSDRSCFLGTYQINSKLSRSDVGKMIQVRYTGKQATRAGDMKMFDVRVSKALVADQAALLIADADIPF